MDALAGPFAVAAALLVIAGVLELHRPDATAGALRALGLPGKPGGVRAGATAGIAIGFSSLVVDDPTLVRLAGALLAMAYLAFAMFVAMALVRHSPIASCGCFGRDDTPPSVVHVTLDLLAAAIAVGVTVEPGHGVPGAVRAQPGLALPFLLSTVVCGYLAYVAFTLLPRTRPGARRLS